MAESDFTTAFSYLHLLERKYGIDKALQIINTLYGNCSEDSVTERVVLNPVSVGDNSCFISSWRKLRSQTMSASEHSSERTTIGDGSRLHWNSEPFRLYADWADELDGISRRFRNEVLDFIGRNKGGVASSVNGFVFVLYIKRLLEFLDFSDSYGKLLLRGKYGVLSKDEFISQLDRLVIKESVTEAENSIKAGDDINIDRSTADAPNKFARWTQAEDEYLTEHLDTKRRRGNGPDVQ